MRMDRAEPPGGSAWQQFEPGSIHMTATAKGVTGDETAVAPPSVAFIRATLRSAVHSPANRRQAKKIVWDWIAGKWPRLVPPPGLVEDRFDRSLPGVSLCVTTNKSAWMLELLQLERGSNRCWTTRAVVADGGDADVVAVQTTCSDLASAPVVAPPGVLSAWVERLDLRDAGVPVTGEPRIVDVEELPVVEQLLCSSERRLPIVVLTNKPGTRFYGADPRGLAEAARGLAHVICLTPAAAALMAHRHGRRLAPVAAEVRIYAAGFSNSDAPEDHPLVRPPPRVSTEGLPVPGHASAFRRSVCRRLCEMSLQAPLQEPALLARP